MKDRSPRRTWFTAVIAVLLVELLVAAAIIYSGIYNVAADDSHWPLVSRMLETMRSRSIEKAAGQVTLLKLDDEQLVLKGAGQYATMCAGCHLAPGIAETELSRGLNPRPPPLAQQRMDPARSYVVIKHGIKMTGMPAWGEHGEDVVRSLVAFVTKLPDLTPKQYRDIVKRAPDNDIRHMRIPDSADRAGPHKDHAAGPHQP